MSAEFDSKVPIGRRYQLHDSLGKGGMGEVFRAYDRLSGTMVALKRVTASNERLLFASQMSRSSTLDFRLALAQEFTMLGSLRHPNIISVLDYGFDADRVPYFTMELLENPRSILEACRDAPFTDKLNLIIQVLHALAYLHRRGIIHRDLKPDNVLVVNNAQVKVLDFGLALAPERDQAVGIAGTLGYMAPELLINGAAASERSDLYAVGIILYQMLVGRHPFTLNDVNTLLEEISTRDIYFDDLDLDAGVVHLLQRLLMKDPALRPADASAVIRECYRLTGSSAAFETPATRESFLQAAAFVGREEELARLTEGLARTLDGYGQVALIKGESGVGKSRLLDELRMRALVEGALVLRGQAIEEGASLYQTWRPVLRWLCLLVDDISDADAAFLALLVPDLPAMLGRELALPSLPTAKVIEQLPELIGQLLSRLSQPLVIILEDLHWARESVRLFEAIAQIVPQLPVMLLGSYRSDEGYDLERELPDLPCYALRRLSSAEIASLSSSMLGEQIGQQPQVLDLLERESEGNIFFILEVVRALAEETGQLDLIGTVTLPQRVFAEGIKTIITRRLARVPANARDLLQIAAVAGRELDLALMQHLAFDIDLVAWLNTCADAAVLDVYDGNWRFVHDKLRQGLLMDISPSVRRILHRRLARVIETLPNPSEHFVRLAYHWGAAENYQKEAHYAGAAALHLSETGLNLSAREYYGKALAALQRLPTTPERLRQHINWAMAFSRESGLHPHPETTALLDSAVSSAERLGDERLIIESLISQASYYYSCGEVSKSLPLLQGLMARAEASGYDDLLLRPANSIGRAMVVRGDYLPARQELARGIRLAIEANNLDLLAGSLAWDAHALLMLGEPDAARRIMDHSLELVSEIDSVSRYANVYSILARALIVYEDVEWVAEYGQRVLNLIEKKGDVHPLFNSYGCLAYIAMNQGDLARAHEYFARSIRLATQSRIFSFVPLYQAWSAELSQKLNDQESALTIAESALIQARSTGQRIAEAEALRVQGMLLGRIDLLEEALAIFSISQSPPWMSRCQLSLAQLYSQMGDLVSSRRYLDAAEETFARLNMRWQLEGSQRLRQTLHEV